ncbi:MAG: DUF4465 domain-containing protein [Tenuifilaceae bacterium]|jgi:hypothetical protein|nr:DUF4465 domain-containing protein [Bacteroidales bacterium]MDI9516581.1 DUF4465 domain-containing protein [Bacteroidota bacterium]NLH57142.1 DUF4465 domain-containing protein [Rikenellaceae bacterium]OQC61801.1 MAG: hypothetical protein BWX49_02035 [Bacteroidetes bacterium ADurb.Bin008]HNV80511.1 DUF4465 domain-containing protein [Tenuifilaceae bacterium]
MKRKKFVGVLALCASVAMLFVSCKKDEMIRETVSFQSVLLDPNSYWNGSDGTGDITIGLATFSNSYNADWDYWEGFAISNMTDIQTPGFMNQYSAYCGGNPDGSNVYAVAYVNNGSANITFKHEVDLVSARICNSTWAYLSMLNGDEFSKKFDNGDWFLLTIIAYNSNDKEVGRNEFYLADFRSADGYIIDRWTKVNLGSLKGVKRMAFNLNSTDQGDWGMNTPAYFCLDDLSYEFPQ